MESRFGCRQWFNLARNTATDEILAVYKMGEQPPKLKANNPITPSGEPTIGSGNLSTSKKKIITIYETFSK